MPEQPPDPDQLDQHDVTAPPDPTHEATPPANPDRDDEAVRRGEDQLDRAGGGH